MPSKASGGAQKLTSPRLPGQRRAGMRLAPLRLKSNSRDRLISSPSVLSSLDDPPLATVLSRHHRGVHDGPSNWARMKKAIAAIVLTQLLNVRPPTSLAGSSPDNGPCAPLPAASSP